MGTDILGWVEIRLKKNDFWIGVVKIDYLVERNYRMFDLLFGGRSGNFDTALAAKRGRPFPLSGEVDERGYSEELTWITWNELEAVDWSQHESFLTEGWRSLFDMMRVLANRSDVSEVRLVVDFY
jgi:hypothetical protein